MEDITVRLRHRVRRGLFHACKSMDDGALEIERLRNDYSSLQQRYGFVLNQWINERGLADQLYTDLVTERRLGHGSANMVADKTEVMKVYELSRRTGEIVI